MSGLGYTECVELSLKPWELPFQKLKWGRFLSEKHTLIWIDWNGPSPARWLFHNGTEVVATKMSDRSIVFNSGDSTLTFGDITVLREGSLLATLFSKFDWLQELFPVRILDTIERKWVSRGVLSTRNNTSCTGWIIHEIVEWK